MATEQPTANDGGASSDPIDRIEAYLAASDGDSTGQPEDAGDSAPKDAAKTPEVPEDGAQDDKQPPAVTTAQLAQFLGVDESAIDVDEDGTPVYKGKIDGKEAKAKFSDLVKTYQLNGHAENRMREATQAAERKLQEADQVIQARFHHQQQSLQQLAALNSALFEDVNQEQQSVDWNALWQADPAQARALERRFEQRIARLHDVGRQIQQRDAVLRQQGMEMQGHHAMQAKQHQTQRLMELIPEWRDDPATRSKEAQEIAQWASQRGYDPQFLAALNDGVVPNAAAIVRDLRNSWKHETLQQSRPAIENKVRSAPKLVKPGQAPSTDGNVAALKSLKQDVRKSGADGQKALEAYLLRSGKA
jgi:hypothetical protein